MYEKQLKSDVALKQPQRPEHMQIAEKMAVDILCFSPDEQNEVITHLRNVSLEDRQQKAAQLKEQADYLLESCEALR